MKITPLLLVVLGAAGTGSLVAQNQSIDWGTRFFPGGNLIDSGGNALVLGDGSYLDGGYTFELGVFDEGFVPNGKNTSEWVASWNVFDAIVTNDEDTNDSVSSNTYTGSDTITFDRHSESLDAAVDPTFEFSQTNQAYVFVRNSDQTVAGSEWLLYTNEEWLFPFVAEENHNRLLVEWLVEDGTQAVFGGINGGALTGDGVQVNANDNDYLVQTFTFVPEPSTFGLLLLGSLSLFRRGRRS